MRLDAPPLKRRRGSRPVRPIYKVCAPLLALLVFQQGEAFSQTPEWRGTVEIETAINLDDGNTQKLDLVFEPELTATLGDWGDITLIGRLRADPIDNIEPGRPEVRDDARSSFSRRGFVGTAIDAELREAYLDITHGETFFRLGKQQVVWGQADGLRVLDAINPLNYREFILGDFEDRRIPIWMLNLEHRFGNITAQFLWIPDHTYDDVPRDGLYQVTSPRFVPSLPPGFRGNVSVEDAVRPDSFVTDDDYGLRVTGFSGGWDWSLNYLYGYNDAQVFRRAAASEGITITSGYERSHLIGGSASNAFGKFTVRAETGFRSDRFDLTTDIRDNDGVSRSSELSYVLGVDYQASANTFLSGQVFQSYLLDNTPGTVRDTIETTISLLARRDFAHNTIQADLLLLQNLNDGDGLAQISVRYAWTSSITLKAGFDVFYGTRAGTFGQFRETDRLTFGVENGF